MSGIILALSETGMSEIEIEVYSIVGYMVSGLV